MLGIALHPRFTQNKTLYLFHSAPLRASVLFYCYGTNRVLHTAIHSFPTRRSSDLTSGGSSHPTCCRCGWPTWTSHRRRPSRRSEEHTSELQSHSGISYAVFCLK